MSSRSEKATLNMLFMKVGYKSFFAIYQFYQSPACQGTAKKSVLSDALGSRLKTEAHE